MALRFRGRFRGQTRFAGFLERGDQVVGELIDVAHQAADLGILVAGGMNSRLPVVGSILWSARDMREIGRTTKTISAVPMAPETSSNC